MRNLYNIMLYKSLNQCVADMRSIAELGNWTLDVQVRAYDVLESVCDALEDVRAREAVEFSKAAEQFCAAYDELSTVIESSYDQSALLDQASQKLLHLKDAVEQASLKVDQMTDLHECAKATFEIWTSKGLFARLKDLRVLRAKAGFRLETKRIGNYVAKTYDLMNEAKLSYSRAQQMLFLSDVSYKVKSGVYADIRRRLALLLSKDNPLA